MCILSWSSQFLQVSLSENCLFLRTDNIHKQIHVQCIFLWQIKVITALGKVWITFDTFQTTFLQLSYGFYYFILITNQSLRPLRVGLTWQMLDFHQFRLSCHWAWLLLNQKKLLHDCINYKHTCFLFESHLPLYQNHLSLDCLLVLQREQLLQPES